MRAILISELFLTPLLRFLDISGNIQRHVLAPRALTQSEMNLNFLGTPYRLGERFTVRTQIGTPDSRLIILLMNFWFASSTAVSFLLFSFMVLQFWWSNTTLTSIAL
jgi:hypothetical protein